MVGFGSIAEHGHLPAWLSFPGVQVCAVADLSLDHLGRARTLLPDAQLFDSPQSLIEHAPIDVVDICTPPKTHVDLIEASCRRGIPHVVCEKPLVLTEDDYARLALARASAGNRIVSVNNWLHSDLFRHVRNALTDGEIGEVRSVLLRTRRPDAAQGSAWNPRWRTDPAHAGGGILLDHGWHQFYLVLGWIGKALEAVSATMQTVDVRHFPVEDEARVTLHFADARGLIELSWHAEARENDGLVEGTQGKISVFDDRIQVDGVSGVQTRVFRGKLTESSYHPDWFESIFRYNVLDHKREEADRNFDEAGVLITAIQAAYRSAAAGGIPVPLQQVGGNRQDGIEKAELHHVCGEREGYSAK